MAAIGIHIAHTAFLAINKRTGAVVDKSSPTTTVGDTLQTEHRHVILPDSVNAPSSSGHPTVDEYLRREALLGYELNHIDQNTIITYER